MEARCERTASSTSEIRRPWPKYALEVVRFGALGVLLLAIVVFVISTWRWPLVWDAQVFRYVNFLVAHGWHPYRDIIDMNLPGCYLADSLVLHTVGSSDLAWRFYDFALLALLTLSACVITMPYEWIGGLFAGTQFALYHALDGPYDAGQRDELLTVLLFCALAFIFTAIRTRTNWLAAGFGFCIAAAVSVKPTAAPLGIAVLLLVGWRERRDLQRWKSLAGWTLLGIAGPALTIAGYLAHHHAFAALIEITRRITPFYVHMMTTPGLVMLLNALPIEMWLVVMLWLILFFRNLRKTPFAGDQQFERACITIALIFGAVSYFVQHKGYHYHRYPMLAFLLLAFAFEVGVLRRNRETGQIATIMFAMIVLLFVPHTARHVKRNGPRTENEFPRVLQQDLRALGEPQLQNRVQCLDLVSGCLTALYREHLAQSTGMIGDLLLFSRTSSPVADYYRDRFLANIKRNPPNAIIESEEWYGEKANFDKINVWPAFAAYLAEDYHVAVTRRFKQDRLSAYRLYVRNGFPAPALPSASLNNVRPR